MKEKQYRTEWKYCCSKRSLDIFNKRLDAVMDRDFHMSDQGRYIIHSLYFDDLYNKCMLENDCGIGDRFKYRIRYYNDDLNYIRLERKEKMFNRCFKSTTLISLYQYEKLIDGDIEAVLWKTEDTLLQQFCVDILQKGFMPKAIIDYERAAYVESKTNIRITLDENIVVSDMCSSFLEGGYMTYPLQEKEQHVLEVKFDTYLPSYMRHIMSGERLVQTSFSKYCLGRKKLQEMGRIS